MSLNQKSPQTFSLDSYIIISHLKFLHVSAQKGQ